MAESPQRLPLVQEETDIVDAYAHTNAHAPALDRSRSPSPSTTSRHTTDEREATELGRLRRNYSRASTAPRLQRTSTTTAKKPTTWPERLTYAIRKFWKLQVSITLPHETCRDHLALERTFLGYLRTSLALSMIGILVAQLFRLQHSPTPDPDFGFYVLGKPISVICQSAAIYTLIIGAFRTWRTQNAMVRGKAISGGFEIILLAGGCLLILTLFLILVIVVDIKKEHLP